MRILLVEDDPQLGDGLTIGLRQAGFAVDWVKDGNSADHALQSETFDLLVLDLGLPRLSGMEVLRRARGRRQTLPVLILTGLSGWANYNEIGGDFLEELHEGLAVTMLTVVFIHIAGVLSGSLMHGENLVRAMLNGRKLGMPGEAIRSARPLAGAVLLAWVAIAGWWIAT